MEAAPNIVINKPKVVMIVTSCMELLFYLYYI